MPKGKIRQMKILTPLSNSRGVALMMAIFIMTILTFLAVEVSYRTSIENNIASQGVSRIRAYYAARAAIELSLFRIHLYKKALAAFGDKLGQAQYMLDPLWQFPFMWPPVLPDEIHGVDKAQIESVVKESSMKASYSVAIESEGGRIDVNDLGADSKELVKATRQQILQVFQAEVDSNEKFAKRYGSFNFEELVNNMIDWVDDDSQSLNGGAEKGYYPDFKSDAVPPSAPFKTLKEMHMVAGMTDELFEVLAKRVTVYGSKGINVNYSVKEVLKSLDPQLTDEIVDKIIKRRSNSNEGGPFQSTDDFYKFIESLGVRTASFNPAKIPLTFDAELNFRIRATGIFGRVSRDIEVVTFDFDNIKERYIEILTKAEKDEKTGGDHEAESGNGEGKAPVKNENGTDPPDKNNPAKKTKLNAPKGRPAIVYWNEN
jgi:general secretion pathway protein K